MRRAKSQIAIIGMLLLLAAWVAGCGTSGNREGQIGTGGTSALPVQQGDPVLAPASGYTGSKTCSACHPNQFVGWSKSLHNAPLKTVAELGDSIFVNDADRNGVNDFKDGLDLSTNPNFSVFGVNAPILGVSGGKYVVTIGGVAYEIQRTQGGNGFWKQRYHTRIGRGYYILPVQYNEKTREYVQYNAGHWYDGSNLPLYTAAYGTDNLVVQFGAQGLTSDKGTQRSWENRCAGCHQTGLVTKAETTSYGGTDVEEAVTGYSELNIGCESCHGPGAAHAASRNPGDIINPDNFKALGVTGLRLANQVCGACHHRGEGTATILSGTTPKRIEYPARFVSSLIEFPTPGISAIDNSAGNPFTELNTTDAYYGVASADFGSGARAIYSGYRNWYADYVGFPIYVASRQHHQQWTDIEQGPHSADASGSTCWSCHDPHEGKGDHQVRNSITVAGTTLATENDDNSLCLACHAGDFGLTVNDLKTGGSAVGTAILAHMGTQAVMGTVAYDPAGTGVGRCSKCHMPKSSSSAIRTAFGIGLKEGDIHNHTFHTIWPSANLRLPVVGQSNPAELVSSCYAGGCHNNDPASTGYVGEIAQWSQSGHADFTAEPFRHWDKDGEIPTSCAKCHSRPGFRDFATDNVVDAAAKLGTQISCGACHTEEGDGTTLFDKPSVYTAIANVTFPSGAVRSLGDDSNLCMACHQGRESGVSVANTLLNPGPYTFINRHYLAAAAILFGADVTAAYEYPGKTYRGQNTFASHVPGKKTCVGCHMRNSADHTFRPAVADCSICHPGTATFDDLGLPFGAANTDYDGDGTGESFQLEIDGLEARLLTEIMGYADNGIGTKIVYAPGSYPYFFNDTNGNGVVDPGEDTFSNRYTSFDNTLLPAAFNYHSGLDPCGAIHNHKYVIQTLRDSIEGLTGSAPPGVRP